MVFQQIKVPKNNDLVTLVLIYSVKQIFFSLIAFNSYELNPSKKNMQKNFIGILHENISVIETQKN